MKVLRYPNGAINAPQSFQAVLVADRDEKATQELFGRTIAHEVVHSFGILHRAVQHNDTSWDGLDTPNGKNVMNQHNGNAPRAVPQDDLDLIQAIVAHPNEFKPQ